MNYYGTNFWSPTNDLCHYGVKGMKWGVRRYQNADGSLTPRGRKRYLDKNGEWTAKGREQYKRDLDYDKRQRNPYYSIDSSGKKHVSPTQNNNRTFDRVSLGDKGVARIQKKVDRGMKYTTARRIERAKAIASRVLISYAAFDISGGGAMTRHLLQSGKRTAYNILRGLADKAVENRVRKATVKIAQEMAWDVVKNRWVKV